MVKHPIKMNMNNIHRETETDRQRERKGEMNEIPVD